MVVSPAFVMLASFLIAFAIVRTSARMTRSVAWWPGGVQTEGGVHLHHLVWGIVLLLVSGATAIVSDLQSPWLQICAGFFGTGAGLTLDEFALWIHLEDVYWTEQGRSSLDAVILATVLGALVLLGLEPLGIDDEGSVIVGIGIVIAHLAVAYVCFAKSRLLLGAVALFFLPVGAIGALRMAKPNSPWARARYSPAKRRRSAARFGPDARQVRLTRRVHDLIGGASTAPEIANTELPGVELAPGPLVTPGFGPPQEPVAASDVARR